MQTHKLPNPYVLADQLQELRDALVNDGSRVPAEEWQACQTAIDWLNNLALTPQMQGSQSPT